MYISLMQEDEKLTKIAYVPCDFMVVKNKNRNNRIWERPLPSDILIEANKETANPPREITQQVNLKRFEGKNYGYYMVIPNMIPVGEKDLKKDEKRVFFLRIFSSEPVEVVEMPETVEVSLKDNGATTTVEVKESSIMAKTTPTGVKILNTSLISHNRLTSKLSSENQETFEKLKVLKLV